MPAILGVNLAHDAETMAQDGVLVRRLNAIENLGSMDILCTDKTGTLTEGVINLEGGYDANGAPSTSVIELAAINAVPETGPASPLPITLLAALLAITLAYVMAAELTKMWFYRFRI